MNEIVDFVAKTLLILNTTYVMLYTSKLSVKYSVKASWSRHKLFTILPSCQKDLSMQNCATFANYTSREKS